jgi:hypothetical protein
MGFVLEFLKNLCYGGLGREIWWEVLEKGSNVKDN